MVKKLALVLLLGIAMLGLAGCGGNSEQQNPDSTKEAEQPEQKAIVLKMGNVGAPDHSWTTASKKMSELVAERTDGKVKIEVYPAGQLGGDREMVEGLQMGTLEMAAISTLAMGSFTPKTMVWDLPYIFPPDYETVDEIVDGPVGDELKEYMETKGFKVLAFWENDWRHLSNSQRPIETLADMEGLKLRIPEAPVIKNWFVSIGVDPTPMPFPELYTALQQGVVDGQDNGVTITYTSKLHEVLPYFTKAKHIYCPVAVMVSKQVWDTLSEDVQTVLMETAQELAPYQREINRTAIAEYEQKMVEDGVQFTELSPEARKEFEESALPLYKEFEDEIGKDLIDKMLEYR